MRSLAQIIAPVIAVATETPLGLTWAVFILFLGGALGAALRAAASETQNVKTLRTLVDAFIGGGVGVLLPAFATKLAPFIGLNLLERTAIEQGVIAMLLGYTGTHLWTAFGWRTGRIVTPEQKASGEMTHRPAIGVWSGLKPNDRHPREED